MYTQIELFNVGSARAKTRHSPRTEWRAISKYANMFNNIIREKRNYRIHISY